MGTKINRVTINEATDDELVRLPDNGEALITWRLMRNGIILAYIEQHRSYHWPLRIKGNLAYKKYWLGFLNDRVKSVIAAPSRRVLIDFIINQITKGIKK